MRQIKVLLVEDNIDHSYLSERAFEDHDQQFMLVVTQTGAKTLVELAARDFDIAFVDYNLPDIDGLTLMKKIYDVDPSLAVVITTGKGSEELAVSTFREGAIDYIIKNEDYFSLLPTVAVRIFKARAELNGQLKRPPFSAASVYEQILSSTADLLDIHVSSLMIFNEAKGHLETKAHRGLSLNYLNNMLPKIGESLEGQAIAEAKALLSHDVAAEPNYHFKELAAAEGIKSVMSVPFAIDDTTRGVLNLYGQNQRRFENSDEQVASHLVKLSTLALQNIKLYKHEHHIAETLQKSHLPEITKRFNNWEIAHRFKVSMEEALLGGDFYDMFPVSEDRRAIVVADVSGKGISAAAQTAMVKYTLRSYALHDPDPASVIAKTHEAFCSYMQTEHFVTIFYGVIDSEAGTISYCSAGHPPALFYSNRQEKIFNLSEVHIPVGAWDDSVEFTTSTVSFSPEDTLLVYTDGLTDCRKGGQKSGELFGQPNLEILFRGLAKNKCEAIADGIMNHINEFSAGRMGDDMAFFVIKLRSIW